MSAVTNVLIRFRPYLWVPAGAENMADILIGSGVKMVLVSYGMLRAWKKEEAIEALFKSYRDAGIMLF
ncbi:MAG: hypothetical protein HOC20_04030, partial [Chloroflexi bacterium]|nr:hypothetical protein [Chloroflexota bacterium]